MIVVVVAFVAAVVVVTSVQKKTMIKIIIEIGSSIVSLCGMGYRTLLRLVMMILILVVVVILQRSTYIDFVFVLPSHDEDDDDSDDYRQSRSEEVDTHPSFSSSKMWSVLVSNDAIDAQLALFSSTGNFSLYFCCCCCDDIL